MSQKTDWFPGTRDEQLAMTKNWENIFPGKQMEWNIPGEEIMSLAALTAEADAALTTAKNEATRTPVATVQCREAF
jgi:hypothetical protein